MGKILGAALVPHPPIILKEIGKGEEKRTEKTIDGLKEISLYIKEKSPETIIIITPHGPLFRDAVSISVEENLSGDFGNFGHPEIKLDFKNNVELVQRIINNSLREDIMVAEVDKHFARSYNVEDKLDHGALVPLYFVDREYKDFKLIHITYGLLSPKELYIFGNCINEAIKESCEDVFVIASGDLSHKLSNDGPYDYSQKGKVFDESIIDIISGGRLEDIISFDLELAESAGECGLRSLMILTGIISNYKLNPQVLSYEGPFGVGYCNAKLDVIGEKSDSEKDLLQIIEEKESKRLREIRDNEDPYVKLARMSLEHYIKKRKVLDIPKDLPKELLEKRKAVFVTLKKDGMLRGCIGTTEPVESNIALEIIRNSVSAGINDPRFDPIEEGELDKLIYSVDVLSPPEKIKSKDELDVNRYGVIVSKGHKKGLLLPMLEGVDTIEEQINIALDKAGIRRDEDYTLERFEVIRHY